MTDLLDRIKTALADRYRIELELDGSRMAVEYIAHDQKLDRPVALHVLRPDFAASLEKVRFLQEMRAAAKLTHPNVLAPYYSGDADGLLYYVMPPAEGESLQRRLARKTRLSIGEAVDVTRHLAAALEHAHDLGIVHRAIKPENILLPEGHAVVADFGVARAVRAATGERFTETRLAPGRPYYMSPEQVLGDQVDKRADLYSLGATLFEMVTGEKLFEGETIQEVVAQHIANPAREPREVEPSVPDWMSDLIVRCLEKAPKDRFQSASEITEALEAGEESLGSVTGESASGEALGVGKIIQGAGWDFDEDVAPDVKPPPQPVYDLGAPKQSAPAAQPSSPASDTEAPPDVPPPHEPVSTGGDMIPGAWMDMDQMAPAAKPEPKQGAQEKEAEEVGGASPPAAGVEPSGDAAQPHDAAAAGAPDEGGLAPIPITPASKWDQVRQVLIKSYDYGPELLVRIARQRVTWYYVGGGVGVVLIWLVVNALFFGPPNLHWQFVRNTLIEPVEIQVDGRVVQTLQSGQQDSMVLPRDRPIEVSWRLMRPLQAGGQQMGEEFWEVLSSGRRQGEDERSVITGVTSDRAMFAPLITNGTRRELVALINPGTPRELRCNCVIPPHSRDVRIGYYPLLENTTIRFFDARRPYSGRYQEISDIAGRVDSLSGAVSLAVEQ